MWEPKCLGSLWRLGSQSRPCGLEPFPLEKPRDCFDSALMNAFPLAGEDLASILRAFQNSPHLSHISLVWGRGRRKTFSSQPTMLRHTVGQGEAAGTCCCHSWSRGSWSSPPFSKEINSLRFFATRTMNGCQLINFPKTRFSRELAAQKLSIFPF